MESYEEIIKEVAMRVVASLMVRIIVNIIAMRYNKRK